MHCHWWQMNELVVVGYYNVILILLSEYLILTNSYCNNRNPGAIHHHRSLSPWSPGLPISHGDWVRVTVRHCRHCQQSTSSSASDIDKQNRRKRRIRRSVVRLATQKIRCIDRFYLGTGPAPSLVALLFADFVIYFDWLPNSPTTVTDRGQGRRRES